MNSIKIILLFVLLVSTNLIQPKKVSSSSELDIKKFVDRILKEKELFKDEKAGGIADGSEVCKDRVKWCRTYQYYCKYESVATYCKKTCRKCPAVTTNINCVDKQDNCANGVALGYCTSKNPSLVDFMKENCQKSCSFCTSNIYCEDRQSPHYCYLIQKRDVCRREKYINHFRKYCAASCRFCKPSCGISELREKHKTDEIVGGVDATKGFYPWIVAIYHKDEFLCGGSLISKNKILTAAHCFNHQSRYSNDYTVVLGEHNRAFDEGTEQVIGLKKIIIHEDYSVDSDNHDIAVLIMSDNARTSDYIYPICLPEANAELLVGKKCMLAGWGKMIHIGESVDILQDAKMPIANQKVCETRNRFNNHKVTNNMICSGYDDGSSFTSGCHGDSGGPLQCEVLGRWRLFGVVSWGSPLCNGLDRYTVFTKVSKYIDWIESQNA